MTFNMLCYYYFNFFLGMANPFGLTQQPPFASQPTAQPAYSGSTTSTLPPPLVPSPNPFLS